MISTFKEFNRNEIDYLYSNDTKMTITQIVGHIAMVLSTPSTKNDLQEIGRSLEKIKANLEKKQPKYTLSSLLNMYRGFGYKDSLSLVTESLTKVTAAVEIKSKIEAKRFPELIEYFINHPEELLKNKELIKTHLNLEILPFLLDKLSTKNLRDVLSLNALSKKAFKKLSKSQILRLCTLYEMPDLPQYAQDFRQILQYGDPYSIRGMPGLTDEEKDAALALYIEHKSIKLSDIRQMLNDEEFLRLAPHLRYVDVRHFDEFLAQQLLKKCSNLNVLLINDGAMLIGVPALPFCEKFNCSDGILDKLPALPLCKELICSGCKYLNELPALPLCEKLNCKDCTRLYTLPALPLCKELNCSLCSDLMMALPALPQCKELICIGCTNLMALPALPLCERLNCGGCTWLRELPALPLCEALSCESCTRLEALPVLSLCKELKCNSCASLRELPALPLCEALLCMACSSLQELPALPYCKKLSCSFIPYLKKLPALPLCEALSCENCTGLQALPALPLCKELCCNDCTNLQGLPALPHCKKLKCSNCTKLQALPALSFCKDLSCCECTGLRELPALPLCEMLCCHSCTGLQTLPALPLCNTLVCRDCTGLLALPTLPFCGKVDCKKCTNLQALPALPHCEVLECNGCTNLTTLPLSLGQNPDLTEIDIEGTRIEPAMRNAILNQCRRMRDAGAVKILPLRLAKWRAIAKRDLDLSTLSVTQKIILNEWLLRLERTRDFAHSQTLLANTVCNILADLFKNKDFQELFFAQAEANNACCEDRAAMSLNEIYTSWKIICTRETLPLSVMTGVAKTLRLRKELQKLIRGDERESVEIFLYYESTLRERLGLETAIQNMTYSEIGNRNWINKDKLVEDVEANFFEELIELPVFEKMMKQRWERINLKFSTQLENLGECPAGGPHDPQVLNYQHRQGEIMQERKSAKIRAAKRVVL